MKIIKVERNTGKVYRKKMFLRRVLEIKRNKKKKEIKLKIFKIRVSEKIRFKNRILLLSGNWYSVGKLVFLFVKENVLKVKYH